MTIYDFTTLPDRLATNAVKWQRTATEPDLIPLWIADMDFPVFPEMAAGMQTFAARSVFGYETPPTSLYEAVINWERDQHGYELEPDQILFIEGAVPALAVAVQAFTKEGDSVIINTPVYPPFASVVQLNNRKLVTNSLLKVNGRFELDFDKIEKDIIKNKVKLYIFCNPHNPGGRVWEMAELQRLGELCRKHGVILISDEIHQDLTLYGNKHHSFQTVEEHFADFSVVLASATKTFNIAGTKNSFVFIKNSELRDAFSQRQLANYQHEISNLGLYAAEVALTKGKPWLTELKTVIEGNINYLLSYFTEKAPKLQIMKPEGSYLLWLDFSAYGLQHSEVARLLEEEAKVLLNDGLTFGREGTQHFRLNTAAPRQVLEEAAKRICEVFSS